MPGNCDVSDPTPKTVRQSVGALVATVGFVSTLGLLGGALTTASADILRSPDGGFTVVEREGVPRRGQSQSAVIRQHGEPDQRHPTVGEPPITRWDYSEFSVFFEGEYVLHSTVRDGSRSDRP